MSDTVVTGFLYLHIAAGFIALLVAPLAMIVRKGGRAHRLWGRIYFYAMCVVVVTAVVVGWARENYIMMLVAVFSFHLVASGYRALYLKKLHKGQRPGPVDWLLNGTAGVFNVALLLWGMSGIIMGHAKAFNYIFSVFGLIGCLFVFRQVHKFFKRTHGKDEWFFDHFTGMIAGYIATVSAFSAVNLEMLPVLIQWLWPTAIGTPVIFLLSRHYRRKFAKGVRAHDIAKVKIAE